MDFGNRMIPGREIVDLLYSVKRIYSQVKILDIKYYSNYIYFQLMAV